jgi:REP element-mobilizing transposase RayT
MPNYRRAFLPGGCWFFTVNLLDRRQRLLVDHIDDLRSAFAATRKNYPFDIVAIVVLPEHLHAVWTLPPDDADFSTRWRLIKTRFAKALPDRERRSAVRAARGERGIWQQRFWGASRRILHYQSGQAWLGGPRAGLAALVVSPRCAARPVSARLGGGRRSRNEGRIRRVRVSGA